jgi:hypothetical protein
MHEASVLPVRAARSGARRVIRLGLSVLLLLGVAVGAELSLDVTNAFAATAPTWVTGQYFSAIKGVPFCYDVSISNSAALPLTSMTAGATPANVTNYSIQDVNLAAGTGQVCGTNNNTAASAPVTMAPVASNGSSATDSVALWSQNECTWASTGTGLSTAVSMFDSNQDLEQAGSQSAFGQAITNGVKGGTSLDKPTCTGGVGVSESGGDGDAWTMNTANPLPTPTDTNPSAAQGDLPSSNLDLTSASGGSVGGCYGALNIFASTSTSAFGTSTASMTLPSSWVNGGDCAYGSLGSNSAGGNTDTAANGPTGDANCPPSQADVNAGLVSCTVVLSSGNDENGSTNYSSLDLFYNGQPVPQTPTATLSASSSQVGGTVSVTGGTNWWGAPDGAPNAAPYGDFQNSAANFYPVSAPSVYIGTSRGSAVPVVDSTVTIPANTYACTGAESTTVGPNPCTLTVGTPSGSFQVPSGLAPGAYNVYIDETNTQPLPGNGPNDSYQTSRGTSLGTAESASTLVVGTPPSITSGASTTFTTGSAGSFTVTTSGSPTPSLTESGALPAGVTFADNGNGTATLAGTPTVSGTYPFTITATNGVGSPASQSFTLTVDAAPAITSADSTTFTEGSAGSFTVTTTGDPTAALSETGALPAGVSFSDNGNGTATLAGTPTAQGAYTITIGASNGVAPDASQSFTLTVDAAPAITSASSTTFTEGSAGSFTVTSTGNPNAALSESGTLPAGVSFVDNGDGTATLAGTPTSQGVYPFTITANNSVGSPATQSFTLTVDGPPTITSTNGTTFAETVMSSFRVTSSATPTATLSETGALPDGVTFTDNGDGTATLSGTPAGGTAGTYTLTIDAGNGFAPDATQTFTLTVDQTLQSPSITSGDSATFGDGSAGSFTVTSTGTPTASLVESGALPTGVSFSDNGDGTGTLAGTPTSQGVYPITITASNGVGSPDVQDFTLTVQAAPAITSADSATFTVGSAGSFTVTSTGTPTAALTESGSLPTGVTFADNGDGTATLAGTPAADTSGTYTFSIGAANGVAPNASQSFTLTVDAAPAIISADSTTFAEGSAGSFTVTTTGDPTAALSETGALPTGVSFSDNGDGTGTLAGTPTSQGVYPITIGASNGVAPDASQSFTLTVDAAPAITSADSKTFTVGSAGSFTVTSTGTPTAALTESGSLPTGVTFADNGDGTATLAGTPAAGTGGSYPITIGASNGVAPDASQSFTLTVDAAPAITSASSTTFTMGSAGTFTVTSTGYPTAALTETGALPAGVSFTDNGDGTATLAGTPTSQGAFPITIHAANGVGSPASQSFTLTVDAAPAITSASSTTFTEGKLSNFPVTATGTPTPTVIESGALPTGVSFSHGSLTGTPSETGTFALTFGAANGVAPNASQSFTLTVGTEPVFTSANNTTFAEGSAGSFTPTATGYPTPSITEFGNLPSGVTFSGGVLSGTPTQSGTFQIGFDATNGVGSGTVQDFTLTVSGLTITSTSPLPLVTEGTPYSDQLTATGGVLPLKWAKVGALPKGLTLKSTGVLQGTVKTNVATGTVTIKVKVTDSTKKKHQTATATFSITINS